MPPTTTRSRRRTDLKLSDEVLYYLESRGIPLPECPPRWKTPEAGEVLDSARFDPERVDRVLRAFRHLRHTQGRFARKPLELDPWQIAYVIAPVFGWVRWDDESESWVRVVNELYVDIPRKNGKSTMCGGLALYLTAADGEQGAQVLAAASTRDQASYVFAPVKGLAEHSPDLKPYLKTSMRRIVHKASGSYFEVVASVAEALHGANVHGAVVDELHIHKTPDLVEAIETGTGSRTQPLVAYITTADDGQQATIYARKRNRIEQLAARLIKHPSVYGVIWAAGDNDDPFAEETWKAANPGYGVSPTRAYLKREAAKAKDDPAELAKFLRLHLGIRTKLDKRYLPLDVWDRNAGMVDEARLEGRSAYGGLDLASTSDLCSLAWCFPDGTGAVDVLWRHWMPERAFDALVRRTSGEARTWRDQGFLRVTPGDVADYNHIRIQILLDLDRFDAQSIAYDRWNASQLVNDLTEENAPMVQMGQGFGSMSAPTKALLHTLLEGSPESPRFRHGGNPLVRWQVDNLRVSTDAAANVKPAKDKSMDKIDGLVAAIMALDGVIRAENMSALENVW
jgi:phage terminase large subunit-like protein